MLSITLTAWTEVLFRSEELLQLRTVPRHRTASADVAFTVPLNGALRHQFLKDLNVLRGHTSRGIHLDVRRSV